MKRFVLSAPPNDAGMVRLYDEDYHYLVRVRRLKTGSCFDALLPDKTEGRVCVLSTADNILIGKCETAFAQSGVTPRLPVIALFQALPKGNKMDTIVRQAAEGGVATVVPFRSRYSEAKINAEKQRRWERIIKEARQQSGSATETEVKTPLDFEDALAYWKSLTSRYERPVGFVLHQEPLENRGFHDYLRCKPDFAALAVGPEGGFSPDEITLFVSAGFKPLLMGNTVLRVDTAAAYATAALRIILLESESWMPTG